MCLKISPKIALSGMRVGFFTVIVFDFLINNNRWDDGGKCVASLLKNTVSTLSVVSIMTMLIVKIGFVNNFRNTPLTRTLTTPLI